jgi:hypothetical protein
MMPAAPTASWRKVCQETLSRLSEDLEQQVEAEVESRLAAAIESEVASRVRSAIDTEVATRVEQAIDTEVQTRLRAAIEGEVKSRVAAAIDTEVAARLAAAIEGEVTDRVNAALVSQVETRVAAAIDNEVEARVSAAIDATVRGAVEAAAAETTRTLSEELDQAVRRLTQAASVEDAHTVLVDVTAPFSERAIIFSIQDGIARAERIRPPASEQNTDRAAESLALLQIPVSEAAAFSTAIQTHDPVVAMNTPNEVSAAVIGLFGDDPEQKVYVFPLSARGKTSALLYAAGGVQPAILELLAQVGALQLDKLAAESRAASAPARTMAAGSGAAGGSEFVGISSLWRQPETSPEPAGAVMARKGRREWWDLSRQDQQLHLSAQRFARVQVAEMRLSRPDALRNGRAQRDIYRVFKEPIDAAREKFREKFMNATGSMVDYFHMELMRSLADDDANLLGPDYPGPLA